MDSLIFGATGRTRKEHNVNFDLSQAASATEQRSLQDQAR